MKKSAFYFLFLMLLTFLLPSTTSSANIANKEPDFYFLPPFKSFPYDSRMLDAADIATSSAFKHSRRRCWHAVKKALFEANLVLSLPTTRYAKEAGDELEQKFNFKKLDLNDPFEAPVGSILVYGGAGAGHVEIRTEDAFVSDFISDHPSTRPLLGIYVHELHASKTL